MLKRRSQRLRGDPHDYDRLLDGIGDARLVLRHGINQTKVAMVMVPVLLLAIGWVYSIWKTGGMQLVDWYFAGYELIYLLWPWTMETRFLLPIAPLACFYIWQGVNGAIHASRVQPRIVGIIWFPVTLLMTISGVHWIYTNGPRGTSDLLDELLIPVWLISSGCAFYMAYTGQSIFSNLLFSKVEGWFKQQIGAIRVGQYAGSLMVVGLVLIGIMIDIRIARENLSTTDLFNAEKTGVVESLAAEVEAGIWLRSHTPPDSVVMARHWPWPSLPTAS